MKCIVFVVFFIALVFAVHPIPTEEKRLLQFSEEHAEWVPVSVVEKLVCDPNVNFMDITDYQYAKEYKEVEALPLPTGPTREAYLL